MLQYSSANTEGRHRLLTDYTPAFVRFHDGKYELFYSPARRGIHNATVIFLVELMLTDPIAMFPPTVEVVRDDVVIQCHNVMYRLEIAIAFAMSRRIRAYDWYAPSMEEYIASHLQFLCPVDVPEFRDYILAPPNDAHMDFMLQRIDLKWDTVWPHYHNAAKLLSHERVHPLAAAVELPLISGWRTLHDPYRITPLAYFLSVLYVDYKHAYTYLCPHASSPQQHARPYVSLISIHERAGVPNVTLTDHDTHTAFTSVHRDGKALIANQPQYAKTGLRRPLYIIEDVSLDNQITYSPIGSNTNLPRYPPPPYYSRPECLETYAATGTSPPRHVQTYALPFYPPGEDVPTTGFWSLGTSSRTRMPQAGASPWQFDLLLVYSKFVVKTAQPVMLCSDSEKIIFVHSPQCQLIGLSLNTESIPPDSKLWVLQHIDQLMYK